MALLHDEIRPALERTVGALDASVEVKWRYPSRTPARPLRARPTASWKTWNPEDPASIPINTENWFYADVVFPKRRCGYNLAGEEAHIFYNGYCPFTLWIDGEEMFREDHVWHATGPIVAPIVRTIEPGRPYRLVLCLQPTDVSSRFNPLQLWVKPAPCADTALDVQAVLSELAFCEGAAATDRERKILERGAARLDLEALRRYRWKPFFASVDKMEKALAPFSPKIRDMTVHLVGHSHIDMDWQWTWTDTLHCIRRDFKAAAGVLEDLPHVRFSMSQVPTYEACRRHDPDVFARVKKLVQEGRWENVAATWVEGDLYMSDGESLARHLLYSARWADHTLGLGARAAAFWAPDTFGHPANMPQIARLGGCDHYFHWRCNPGGEAFWPARFWEGVDGSEILAISSAYGGGMTPATGMWCLYHNALRSQAMGLRTSHHVWGCGDHGGGLARWQAALADRYGDRPLLPKLRFSTLAEVRDAYRKEKTKLPRNRGETHTLFEGCYTSHAKIKEDHRRGENALLAAEAFCALAGESKTKALREAWCDILFNQFHDILCGCGLPEPYKDARARTATTLAAAKHIEAACLRKTVGAAKSGKFLALANPCGFARSEPVLADLPENATHLKADAGFVLPLQRIGETTCFMPPETPAFGSRSFAIGTGGHAEIGSKPIEITETPQAFCVEAPHYRCRIDRASGAVTSFYDKKRKKEFVANGIPKYLQHTADIRRDLAMNLFTLSDEQPNTMSAWVVSGTRREEYLVTGAKVTLVETGPVCACFRVEHRVRSSTITEEILCWRDAARIDFDIRIDWRETGGPDAGVPQLKLAFATGLAEARSLSEGPYVVQDRPADGQEQPTQRWAAILGKDAGFAILNDGRYGFDALGGRLRMTLLRNAYYPDADSDNGEHRIRLAFVPVDAKESKARLVERGMAFNRPLRAVRSRQHSGATEKSFSLHNAPGVVCTALRPAEDGDGVVLRLVEFEGKSARARLRVGKGIRKAQIVNLLEETQPETVSVKNGEIALAFRPCEIKTIKFPGVGV